jgi:hypothetical protein
MKEQNHILNNETGSLMVIAVVLLMLLTIMGLAITTTTSIELQIAANDRIHKTTFYAADGGTEVASELLEQNLGCMGGFSTSGNTITAQNNRNERTEIGDEYTDIANIRVFDEVFWQNRTSPLPSDTNRDIVFPAAAETDPSIPHTNITAGYNPGLSTGSAIQMVSGYEGKGKAVGSGGAYLLYAINSQHRGIVNSESIVQIQWRHMVGSEGACNH